VRVIGIDPGSRRTGVGVVAQEAGRLRALHYEVLSLGDGAFPERIGRLAEGLDAVLARFPVEAAAVETVYVKKNAGTALKLGQARGAAVASLVRHGLPVGEYAPAQIKEAVVGRGQADKAQVGFMVQQLLGLREPAAEDAADALGVAICHAHSQRLGARLGVAR
jgi:crossover junction endodeoxyribonuclease RuvC